jgi:orotate phosphoribosyltransferase
MCYASDKSLEIHRGSIRAGDRVVVVDDVLASGGSALAAVRLVERAGGVCVGGSVRRGHAGWRVQAGNRTEKNPNLGIGPALTELS